MEEAKIYNVCLQRVKFQITNVKQRLDTNAPSKTRQVLESYNTGDIAEIVDILELYDLEEHTREGLAEKLDDLAYTVSVLVKDKICFDYDEKGNLGIYLLLRQSPAEAFSKEGATLAVA